MPDRSSSILLGGPHAGKTTLLVQLFGRLQAGGGALTLRSTPSDLTVVRAGLARLAQGLPVEHTATVTVSALELPATCADGSDVDIVLPDYGGEQLRSLVRQRHVNNVWLDFVRSSERWFLVLRLDRHVVVPNVVTHPIVASPTDGAAPASVWSAENDDLPGDLWAVELLQILEHTLGRGARGAHRAPRLTLVLSCWDELDVEDGTPPAELARERMPLVADFAASSWAPGAFDILGMSAQGRPLDSANPSEAFMDCGPETMGYLIRADGTQTADLTELLLPS